MFCLISQTLPPRNSAQHDLVVSRRLRFRATQAAELPPCLVNASLRPRSGIGQTPARQPRTSPPYNGYAKPRAPPTRWSQSSRSRRWRSCNRKSATRWMQAFSIFAPPFAPSSSQTRRPPIITINVIAIIAINIIAIITINIG